MNVKLKTAIYRKFLRQNDCARECGLTENQLSRLIHGRDRATSEQMKELSRVLGVPMSELFSQ
jgi:transcriptional regulator with XRE-family HTH domain